MMRAGKDYLARMMRPAPSDVDFRIAKLELGPSDYLAIKVRGTLSMEAQARLRDQFANVGIKNRVLVMDDNLDLAVLSRSEVEDQRKP